MALEGGSPYFLESLAKWPEMDSNVQCDVVKCFDCIRHDLLMPRLRLRFGPENEDFLQLIHAFLTTDIYDRNEKNYACREVAAG